MIIDGHAHACGVYSDLEKTIKYLDDNNIDKVILSAGEPSSTKNYGYPMMSNLFKGSGLVYGFNKIIGFVTKLNGVAKHIDEQNEYVWKLAKESKGRIINTYWFNPLDDECMDKLEKNYDLYNFKIIKMHQCWNKFSVDNENFLKAVKWAKEKSTAIFIHLGTREEVIKFIEVTNKYKDVIFIVAHMIGADEIISKSKNSNIFFDLSAPQLYSLEILKKSYEALGSKKFIIGSDTPYGKGNIQINIDRLQKLNLSNEEMEDILGNNILNILESC